MIEKKMSVLAYVSLIFLLSSCVAVERNGITKNKKASDLNVQLGIGYIQQNNLEVANQKLNKALIQNPESAVAHNAFAILQERLLQLDKAEKHYKMATTLDVKNSSANNNYGAFLCKQGRQAESEQYFMRAVKQPLYRTPEFAYTNAAVCLMQIEEYTKAEAYLKKALAARNNFGNALINLADLYVRTSQYEQSLLYLKRFHLVKNKTAKSLWIAAQSHQHLGNSQQAKMNISVLAQKFPESTEYNEWKAINK